MGNRGTDIEEFLMTYPHMRRWSMSVYRAPQRLQPEMPEPTLIPYHSCKLRHLVDELSLDENVCVSNVVKRSCSKILSSTMLD